MIAFACGVSATMALFAIVSRWGVPKAEWHFILGFVALTVVNAILWGAS